MDDLALLHRYARQGSETAFTTVVRRYVDLVHSAALRQVRSPDLASDVTQRVFLELSASIAKLRPDTHLAAWLFVVTRRTAIDTVRREASRQRREQAAAEASAMNVAEPPWANLRPQLDEALATLAEADRQVILLRFFEERSLAEIGRALGASENAAQKNLTRALDRLHTLLAKRGVTATAAGLATELSAHAVQSAPALLTGQIATALLGPVAALSPTLFSGTAATGATFAQKALVLGAVVLVTGLAYQARLIRELNSRGQLLASAVAELDAQIARARPAQAGSAPLGTGSLAANPMLDDRLRALLGRIVKLKQRLEQHPEQKIPELRYLTTTEWIKTAQRYATLESDADFARALSHLRTAAKHVFGALLREALLACIKANGGRLPTDHSPAMKRGPKILLVLCAVATVGLGLIQTRDRRRATLEVRRLEQQLAARRQQLVRLRLRVAPRPPALAASTESAPVPITPTPSGDPHFDANLHAVVARIEQLKARLVREPRLQIPELRFLSDTTWFEIAERRSKLQTDQDERVALAELRREATSNFTLILSSAGRAYMKASGEKPLTATADLGPYLVTAVDAALLARYEVDTSRFNRLFGLMTGTMEPGGPGIRHKAPSVDPEADKIDFAAVMEHAGVKSSSLQPPAFLGEHMPDTPLELAALGAGTRAFRTAHPDREPRDAAELASYFDDKGDAERFLKWEAARPGRK